MGKTLNISAKDVDSKRKFEIKAKKISACKRPIFWSQLNSGKIRVYTLLQNICLFTKYNDPLSITKAEIRGLFIWQKAQVLEG